MTLQQRYDDHEKRKHTNWARCLVKIIKMKVDNEDKLTKTDDNWEWCNLMRRRLQLLEEEALCYKAMWEAERLDRIHLKAEVRLLRSLN